MIIQGLSGDLGVAGSSGMALWILSTGVRGRRKWKSVTMTLQELFRRISGQETERRAIKGSRG